MKTHGFQRFFAYAFMKTSTTFNQVSPSPAQGCKHPVRHSDLAQVGAILPAQVGATVGGTGRHRRT